MSQDNRICPDCGSPLPPSEVKEATATTGLFKVRATGPAPQRCPSGCQPSAMEFPLSMGMIFGFAKEFMRMAAKEKGFFKKRNVCPKCGDDLVETGAENTWKLEEPTPDGGMLSVEITGPGLLCPRCQASFLPRTAFKTGLGQAIGSATTSMMQGN